MGRRSIVIALAALLVVPSIASAGKILRDPNAVGLDFWKGVGRVRALGAPPPATPDLSGSYKVEGLGPDSTAYTATMEMKKSKTLTTPQGAKFNVFQITWDFGNSKAKGVGMWIGSRLYACYGSENALLGVAAPFQLAESERPVYDHYAVLARKVSGKQDRLYIKNPPWFADYYTEGLSSSEISPSYYMLWVNAKGGYGDNFIDQTKGDTLEWDSWRYWAAGTWRKDNGDIDYAGTDLPFHWHVRKIGPNFNIHCRDSEKYVKDVEGKNDVDGTSFVLADGTVVMILGGNDDSGFGYYEVKGGKLVGDYAIRSTSKRGTETLTPGEAVVGKNAGLFSN